MQLTPNVDEDNGDRIASLYLSQIINFLQFMNIIFVLKIYQNQIESNTNLIFDFLTGNVLAFASFDCLFPSN